MKKRQQGSLFNYFKPVVKESTPLEKTKTVENDIEALPMATSSGRKRVATKSPTEKERATKRRKDSSDDSGDEYHPPSETVESSSESSAEEMQVDITPVKRVAKKMLAKTPINKVISSPVVTPRSLGSSSYSLPPPVTPSAVCQNGEGKSYHDQLPWLRDDNRRDKNGRRPSHPEFSARTLHVPVEFLKSQSPGLRQWWLIKADNFDTVIMFKVGKFYELYHMDAVIGVQELGLVFMKGEYAHSGFPEVAFSRYAQTLVQKGFKVARVEQTETPDMMQQRLKQMHRPTKFDRVVQRELCSIISKGTRTLSFMGEDAGEEGSAYLVALKEDSASSVAHGSLFGVCFIDTCIGTFHLSQFQDDRQCSRLRTLLAHHCPAQLLTERSNLSPHTSLSLTPLLSSTIREMLAPVSEFWTSSKTLELMRDSGCFSDEDGEKFSWPKCFQPFVSQDDPLQLTAASGYELAVSALGACLWYLQRCFIDKDLLSINSFEVYTPLDCLSEQPTATACVSFSGQLMILDDVTLANLDVVDNEGRKAGTLMEKIDHTSTPFGKRLLKQWLCSPSCDPTVISARLDTVEDLLSETSLLAEIKEYLKKLPDLERLLRKIHTLGLSFRSTDHPDARAIFYSENIYSKRKIGDFISVLDGLQLSLELLELCHPLKHNFKSKMLKRLVTMTTEGGKFPNMAEQLKFFQSSFNREQAKKAGVIVPSPGVDAAYDSSISQIKATESELQDYLAKQRKRLGTKNIVYWSSGRNRYQLEVPEAVLSRHTPDDYQLMSQKKGHRRYWTREIEQMLEKLVDAEGRRDAALKDTMRSLFSSFDQHFSVWESAVRCLGSLDVLASLATYSAGSEGEMCRPTVTAPTEGRPLLKIMSGRHPCVSQTFSGEEFIPNDVLIEDRLCTVVTGPNMGGKSTLMRQTGLIVILAQLGCYVPASSCQLTPVDRLFTRLGASDRIMSGESTFFVELSETSTILQHATAHSLVLLDELGRGTATYDGTAIACAVVQQLAELVRCRTLFSTHYHSLVEEFSTNPHIQLGHMSCMVELEEEGGVADEAGAVELQREETVTFLYKFTEGSCPKSYGFNAAYLAGLPRHVIQLARRKAHLLETATENIRRFRHLMSSALMPEY